MKRVPLLLVALFLFVCACSDKFDNNSSDDNRYFIYKNTTPYYFYDSTGAEMIKFGNKNTYPLSYVTNDIEITLQYATYNHQLLSNWDGIAIDTAGKTCWYSYNKGCYDSTHFRYYVHTPYLEDTIDIEYLFDTINVNNIMIYVHKFTYNGVVINAYEEDSTKHIASDHIDVFKYKDKTVVKPVYKEKSTK
ncbi:MAG: hypothetical protein J5826_08205 [Bacteroidales bacterium]|nr:hypothetical protein [Bacteroidales bacterium]